MTGFGYLTRPVIGKTVSNKKRRREASRVDNSKIAKSDVAPSRVIVDKRNRPYLRKKRERKIVKI